VGEGWHLSPLPVEEPEAAVALAAHRESTFMQTGVVPVAEPDHVVEIGVAAIYPVDDVVAVEMSLAGAAGVLAVPVPVSQGSL
jgi:hypothetical protein